MGTLYLVRHGQASFGAEDSDNLSALGQQQSVRRADYFRQKDLTFNAVLTSTLRRHQQTYAAIREGMKASFTAGPPQGETAPSGGSAAHEVASVGAKYIGRFAPSPTGPLHAGSLVAALASWLDARAHGGRWLVRMEDVDTSRCIAGADQTILAQLAACGLISDEPPVYQSQRGALYQRALDQLVAAGWAYPCGCTRQDIERALAALGQPKLRHQELVYPGTCRQGLNGRAPRAWRFSTKKYEENWALAQTNREQSAINSVANDAPTLVASDHTMVWHDRWLGAQAQHVSREVGDFVLKRADGFWAYQLAVVADDAAQGVTDIVRGQDLADNTARQILLQRALGVPMPRYLHTPLVLGANGEKLSKQNGAQALDLSQPLQALNRAAAVLRLTPQTGTVSLALTAWLEEWKDSWGNTRRASSPLPDAPA